MHAVLIVAAKEFRDGLRNRWVLAITAVYGLLSLGLAYFGAAAAGTIGFTSLATTIVSLASLATFLIPLIALFLGYDTVVGEESQGTLLLLLTYPLSRVQLLAGKFLGHGAILAVSAVAGFGVAGVVIGFLSSAQVPARELWSAFAFFVLTATLLGWAFLGMAHAISAVAAEKSTAAGLALVLWFLLVLIFDMGLLGALVATGGTIGADVFPYLLLLNPTDVFRLANLTGFEAARTYSGLIAMGVEAAFTPGMLLVIMVLWVIGPFLLAATLFQRREV